MRARTAVLLLLAALALTGCGDATTGPPAADDPAPSPSTPSPGWPELPAGWRWESFGGIQVGVPGEWGWGNASQRINQWCTNRQQDLEQPIVGRPAANTLVGCVEKGDGPPPEMQVAKTGDLVYLSWAFEQGRPDEGDRTTLHLGDVDVVIQVADAQLRRQIAATAHRVDVDAYGCPAKDPIAQDPAARPDPPVDVSTLTGVSAVSVCRYGLYGKDMNVPDSLSPLFSSLRLEGSAAQDVVDAIAAAPAGGGPDNPDDCLPEVSYGDDAIVLRVTSDQGASTLHVYYSGCDHNGFDDGVTVRRLTRAAMAPLIVGPNQVMAFSGREEKRRIILGE